MSEQYMTRAMRATETAREARAAEATRAMGTAVERTASDMARATGRSAARLGRATEHTTSVLGQAAERSVNSAIDTAFGTGMAWWDLMLRMQRASLQSLSVYSPRSDTRISASRPTQEMGEAVIPVGEERLNVATQTLTGETTRIRRRVIETPVEQEVTLREERVVVERRPGSKAEAGQGEVLVETVIEMSDSRQVPQVWKSVHVAEEVVLRREVTERTERVRDTLKRDVVEVEHEGGQKVSQQGGQQANQQGGQQQGRADLSRPAEQEVGRSLTAENAPQRAEAEGDAARRQAEQAAEERRRREQQAKEQPQQAPGGRKG